MKYRNVGKAGIKVSEIALGSWMTDLKESSEEDVAKEVVKLAYENGINFFDCADAYSGGAAERFFGEVLKEFPRKDLVISSKVYFPTGDGVNDRGLSRKHIMENCEQSLKNMNLDYLDLYYCHRYDENTDLEETLRAMSDLVAQGKVLYYGVSEEWGSARIEEAQKIITYMEAGGKVMIFTEYTGTDMPNLKSVLENYGVTTGDGVIMEGDTGHYIMQRPYYIVPTIDSSDITSDIKSNNRYVLAPISQPVKTLSDYRDTLEITPLLSTSDKAYTKKEVQNMSTYEKEDGDEEGSFQVGVSVTEQVDDDNTTQLVYFGCASLLDEATDQQVSGGNTDLVLAVLGWMCENDAPVIDVTSKSLTMSYLTVPQFDAAYWSIIVCGVIPVAFLLIGTLIWFKRRKQ